VTLAGVGDWADDGRHAVQRLHDWRRGLLRLWIVASVAWAIGMTIGLTHQGAEFAQLLVDLQCDALRMTSAEWQEC
jgi:hypothetical protein